MDIVWAFNGYFQGCRLEIILDKMGFWLQWLYRSEFPLLLFNLSQLSTRCKFVEKISHLLSIFVFFDNLSDRIHCEFNHPGGSIKD